MKVYISGMISGLSPETVKEEFGTAETILKCQGHIPVNPLNNGLESSAPWAAHMVADIKMLLDCDSIYMINGWKDSRGAKIEHYIASTLGMGVIYQSKD